MGLSAILAASATALTVIKLIGAAYRVYLGVSAIWHARSAERGGIKQPASIEPVQQGHGSAFRQAPADEPA